MEVATEMDCSHQGAALETPSRVHVMLLRHTRVVHDWWGVGDGNDNNMLKSCSTWLLHVVPTASCYKTTRSVPDCTQDQLQCTCRLNCSGSRVMTVGRCLTAAAAAAACCTWRGVGCSCRASAAAFACGVHNSGQQRWCLSQQHCSGWMLRLCACTRGGE